jgi:hypothetical protein
MKNPPLNWIESWTCRKQLTHLMAGFLIIGLVLVAPLSATHPVLANEQTGPWECSSYTGDAHTRCLNAFIEEQQGKISKLEGELRQQQSSMNELRDRVDRQRAAAADLERQLSDRTNAERLYAPPLTPFYSYSYSYPPVGLGLYFGSPWYYGPPYLYRPFGPSFYFGPRRFGHRYFGCRGRC